MKSSTSSTNITSEQWKEEGIAARYARAENATQPFAEIMVDKSKIKESKATDSIRVLDIATGTGIVVATLQNALSKDQRESVEIIAGDISDSMLEYVKDRGAQAGWKNVEARNVDGANVGTDETFTHIFANFAIFALPADTLPTTFSLLRPGGFIAISTWAYFPWYSHLARAMSLVPGAPEMPPYEVISQRLYNGVVWNTSEHVREALEKTGFGKVELVQEKRRVDCGTPEQYVEVMRMPIQFLALQWEDLRRTELVEALMEKLVEVASEDVDADGKVYLEFEAIVGWGWKA